MTPEPITNPQRVRNALAAAYGNLTLLDAICRKLTGVSPLAYDPHITPEFIVEALAEYLDAQQLRDALDQAHAEIQAEA